jgi:hypothetical protein
VARRKTQVSSQLAQESWPAMTMLNKLDHSYVFPFVVHLNVAIIVIWDLRPLKNLLQRIHPLKVVLSVPRPLIAGQSRTA